MAPRTHAGFALAAALALLAGCGRGDLLDATAEVVVEVSPGSASVEAGATQQFTASVSGSADTAVEWSVQEGAAGGAVSAGGLYTAPAAAGTFHVVARSHAVATRSAAASVTVTPAPAVVVGLSPTTATLLAGRARQFTASVAGTADTAVWWSVREGSAGGTVTSDGLYTAPATAGTYHVVVTSQADPTRSAAATVSVTEVAVSLAPASITLVTGQSQQFTATVTGTTDTAVAWSVEEGASGGTVTSGGLYVAPAATGTFHVVATSAAQPGKSARAAVTVEPPPVTAVAVTPAAASLLTGASQPFSASVTGGASQAVDWSVREGASGGAVTAGGLYTAPATPGTFHVVATSQADATRSGAAVVTVTAVGVSLSPASADLLTGRAQQFTASVSGSADTAVAWSVLEGAAGGTVTSGGLYTAPATPGTFHVVATSHADAARSASAAVTVTQVAVSISPGSAALPTGRTQQFTATVTGTADAGVAWSVQEGAAGGTVTSGGLYTAPSAGGTYHVVATSLADPSRSAVAAITVTQVSVSVSPGAMALLDGEAQQFTASVTGSADAAVTWAVQEGAAGGAITAAGLYTAPATAGTFHVVATSHADPARSGGATVTVVRVGVALAPAGAVVLDGRTQPFSATVTGTTQTAVAWSVQEGSAGGTVTADGLYTAPATAGTFHVVATSQVDPRRSASAAVTVVQVAVALAPASAAVLDGRTQQFAATVTGTAEPAVTWSVQEGTAGGTVSAGGLYTAPATAGTYHVVATSQLDPRRSASAAVTVARVGVALAPPTAWVVTGRTQPFTATVTGAADGAVTWSIQEGAAGGAITAAGLYTAPTAPGTYHVIATSLADPRRSAVATVTVTEVAISLSPDAVALDTGERLQFTATVTGSPDPSVTWTVLEGTWCGSVVDGSYTAPDASGTCHLVATSVADPSRSATAEITVSSTTPASIWDVRLGTGVIDGGPRAGTWDLDPAGHPDTLIVAQTPNATSDTKDAIDLFYGPVGGPMAHASIPIAAVRGVAQPTAIMDTAAYKLHLLAPAGNLFSLIYVRAAVQRGPDGRITGFAKEVEVAFSPPTGAVYSDALIEVVDGAGHHRLAGVMVVDDWYAPDTWVLGFVTSVAGGVAPTEAAQFTGFGGGPAFDTLATFQHTGGAGALDGAYGCMSSVVQQPTTGTIYAFSARGLHGVSTDFHRIFPIALTAPGATTWAPAPPINYSDAGTGSNYAFALPSGHVYWSWEDGTDSRISRVNPDGSLNLAPLPALGFRAEFNPGACHVAVQGDRVMTILHEWGVRARVYVATGVDHDAPGTSPVAWQVTQLQDPTTDQYPLLATGVDGLGRSGGHWWSAMLSAHYSSVHVESWLIVAPFP